MSHMHPFRNLAREPCGNSVVPMAKVVVSEFISVDGVIEDPGGAEGFSLGGWTFKFDQGPDGGQFKFDELTAADSLLLGRVTYGAFAAAWPTMEGTGDFGERMNSIRKHVVSSDLPDPEWSNTTLLGEDWVERVSELRGAAGGDLLVLGSAQLAQGLADHGLVDEYRLMTFPIVLGAGKRLFAAATAPTELTRADTRPVGDDGVVVLTYAAKRDE
jgi:dihydrofolate reductase